MLAYRFFFLLGFYSFSTFSLSFPLYSSFTWLCNHAHLHPSHPLLVLKLENTSELPGEPVERASEFLMPEVTEVWRNGIPPEFPGVC